MTRRTDDEEMKVNEKHPVNQWELAFLWWCGLVLVIVSAWLHIVVGLVPATILLSVWVFFLAREVETWCWFAGQWRALYYELVDEAAKAVDG